MDSLTSVTIDFETSHLVFPTIIAIVLGLLNLAILIRDRRAVVGAGRMWTETLREMDKTRIFGSLALIVAYFLLMVPVGNLWPNAGYGFLICSISYIGALGLLFMHERTLGNLVATLAIALLAPPLVWWLFSKIFFLTLP